MNLTGIETFDLTWNPLTGCHNGCAYCYARSLARRWHDPSQVRSNDLLRHVYDGMKAVEAPGRCVPFPADFTPTFYRTRLEEPNRRHRPARIFVCSMGDLWSPGVPGAWVDAVVAASLANPQHRFYFLTKRPDRLAEWRRTTGQPLAGAGAAHLYFGTSVVHGDDGWRLGALVDTPLPHRWVSYEPCLQYLDLSPYCAHRHPQGVEWVVVGGLTGRGGHGVERRLLDQVVLDVAVAGVPLYLKANTQATLDPRDGVYVVETRAGVRHIAACRQQAADGLG